MLALALSAAAPGGARAQQGVLARADTLLLAGRVFSAESLYYYAVRRDPRDPMARLALGKYLAERGALRVGAVLMEEARYFGGDPALVARELAPVYERLGDWEALVTLPSSPLPYADRARAEWLRDHAPRVVGPDSATVPYAVSDSHLLGEVSLRIGDDTVTAVLDARVRGLVLDSSWARRPGVRRFAAKGERDARRVAVVVDSLRLGPYTLTGVEARLAPGRAPGTVLLGMDVLSALAPTFDPMAGRIVLRRDGRVPPGLDGWSIATLTNATGVYVLKSGTLFPLGHPDVQRYLRASRWTLDARRGAIIVVLPSGAGT